MSSPVLLAALLLSSTAPVSAPAAAAASSAVPPAPTVPVGAATPAAGPSGPSLGVGLLSVGTALAAGSTVALTLATVLSTPDRETAQPTATEDALNTVGGFVGAAVLAVGAALAVVGAGMTLSELNTPPPATPAATP